MIKPNSIDFKTGTFVSCGIKTTIVTDAMAYDRIVRFIQAIPVLSNGISFQDFQSHITKQMSILRSPNSMAANYVDAFQHTMNLHTIIANSNDYEFFEKNIDQHLRFCALFCIHEGEDMTRYSKTLEDKKIENWKKDMNLYDFFLLSKSQLPGYKDLLNELYDPQKIQEREQAKARVRDLKETTQ